MFYSISFLEHFPVIHITDEVSQFSWDILSFLDILKRKDSFLQNCCSFVDIMVVNALIQFVWFIVGLFLFSCL